MANIFSTNDGLPSNHVYDLCEDNDGFLWIATDNGISRFDGTKFINYSTKNGLPSNDVLQIAKEKDGTIWVNCYKQPPSYFDKNRNCFISFENDKSISRISNSFLNILIPNNGGIIFQNELGIIQFQNKKITQSRNYDRTTFFINNNKNYLLKKHTHIKGIIYEYSFYDKTKIIGSYKINYNDVITGIFFEPNSIYNFSINSITVLKDFNLNFFSYKRETITVPETIKWYKFYKNDINVMCNSGTIYIYDKNTLKLKNKINNSYKSNCAITDKNNNLWIGTLENGLLYYNVSQIHKFNVASISNNFLSITANENGLFAGNFAGQIIEKEKDKTQIHSILSDFETMWMREIFCFKNNTIAISDAGYTINFKKNVPMLDEFKVRYPIKMGAKFNDSIVLLGSNIGIIKFNIINKKYKLLNSPRDRILAIKKLNDTAFYFVANRHVFLYDINSQKYKSIFSNESLKNDGIDLITTDKDDNLWISTKKGSLLLLNKNKNIILKIPNSKGLPNNIFKLIAIEKRLWISSKSGIYIIDYDNLQKYSIHKLSKFDGLPSNVVNSIYHYNGTIYAATSNGIASIPSNITFPKFEILPFAISININNKIELLQSNYKLNKDQKYITIQLSGIELSGHLKNLQYAINSQNDWVNLEGNILNLFLKEGENKIVIKAVDVNNNISTKKLVLSFDVAIPFYNQTWFWALVTFVFAGFIFWIINKRKLAKQQTIFQQQLTLEKERNKITADLHDEIGSTLSSLQINSAVANKLMERDIVSARKVLLKVEEQSKSLAEKIGDIIWSMKPRKDQFMTLSTRIKNFCNEVLGSTNINYTIKIDNQIDILITDFGDKKNLLLIVKEAINNALKYSKSKKIDISIQQKNNKILVLISDDGIGFNPNEISGNGIGNMKNRATELKATFQITSNQSSGTTIQLEFEIIP